MNEDRCLISYSHAGVYTFLNVFCLSVFLFVFLNFVAVGETIINLGASPTLYILTQWTNKKGPMDWVSYLWLHKCTLISEITGYVFIKPAGPNNSILSTNKILLFLCFTLLYPTWNMILMHILVFHRAVY